MGKDSQILLATFPTLQAAEKGINGYFYSNTITLFDAPSVNAKRPTWTLQDSMGKARPAYIVEQKGKRFRFILTDPSK